MQIPYLHRIIYIRHSERKENDVPEIEPGGIYYGVRGNGGYRAWKVVSVEDVTPAGWVKVRAQRYYVTTGRLSPKIVIRYLKRDTRKLEV